MKSSMYCTADETQTGSRRRAHAWSAVSMAAAASGAPMQHTATFALPAVKNGPSRPLEHPT